MSNDIDVEALDISEPTPAEKEEQSHYLFTLATITVIHQPHHQRSTPALLPDSGPAPAHDPFHDVAKLPDEIVAAIQPQLKAEVKGKFKMLSPRCGTVALAFFPPVPVVGFLHARRQQTLLQLEAKEGIDTIVSPRHWISNDEPHRRIGLAVFDMDSTLIQQEVIDELARFIGKYDEVAIITERAMRGELDFAESLKARVALLRGVNVNVWKQMESRISFTPGAKELCTVLKRNGAKMAVLSGGFVPMAMYVKHHLGLDMAMANQLEMAEANAEFGHPHFTGRLLEGHHVVTAERKRLLLLALTRHYNVPLRDVLCVGDGANDLPMLNEVGAGAGVAIALNAKPKVQASAPNSLNSKSMRDILYCLGWKDEDIDAQLADNASSIT